MSKTTGVNVPMTYGIKDICERYGVGEHTVLGWIHSGELRAINVARRQGTKPKWRITEKDIEAFETSRTHAGKKRGGSNA